MREYDLSAFETVDPIPLAEISKRIDIIDDSVRTRHNGKAWFDGPLNPNVALIRAFPGMNPKILQNLPELGYEGVVIEGFGSGNLPIGKRSLIPAIEELTSRKIPVVITTQCLFGRTEILVYETGKNFSDLGVISGHDMITEVAVIKLMWALNKTKDPREIESLMHANLVGEINHLIEIS
jgi:glutamyl-tRNA(Gln) amidotransferase subunit D